LKQRTWNVFWIAGLVVVILLGYKVLRQQRVLEPVHTYTAGRQLSGEEIAELELVSAFSPDASSRTIRGDSPTFVFVFESPCAPCNDNIPYWNSICRMVEGRAQCLGVLPGAIGEALKALENRLDFPLYRPEDTEIFSRAVGLGTDGSALTMFICDRKILEIYRGCFAGDAFARFINACKSYLLGGR